MKFSLFALAPLVAFVAATPQYGYTPPSYGGQCTPTTIFSTRTGYSTSTGLATRTSTSDITTYSTATLTRHSESVHSYVTTRYSTIATSCPVVYTTTRPVVITTYVTQVGTSYTLSSATIPYPVSTCSTVTSDYTTCVTNSGVIHTPVPVVYTTTASSPYTTVFPVSTSRCPGGY